MRPNTPPIKPILGFPGYGVSVDGRVWSKRTNGGGAWKRELRPLRGTIYNTGYCVVRLRNGHTSRRFAVHRLVCTAFHGAPSENQQVRHLNGRRSDNRAENLRWGTNKENSTDRFMHGTMCRGETHYRTKFTASDIRRIRKSKATGRALAAEYVVCPATIYAIRAKRNWKHV